MDNPYIFRNGVTQRFRGKTLVEHAVRKFALNRFVIFYPEDAYGVQSMRILFEEINRLGGEVIVSESYPPDSMDFADEIRHVIEVDLGRYGALIPAVEMNPNEKPQYIPGFDAIIIHGDPLKSGMLAAQLVFHDVQDRILLVTDGERSPEFLSAGNRFVEGAIMVNEFFEESPDPIVRGFVERYRKRFREPPDLFSAQAYDSIQMILHAMESGYTSRDQLRRYLAQIHRFHGVSGMTSFDPSGQVEKSLFVIQVQNGKYVQVN